MPTPSTEPFEDNTRAPHNTCPPEDVSDNGRRMREPLVENVSMNRDAATTPEIGQMEDMSSIASQSHRLSASIDSTETHTIHPDHSGPKMDLEEDPRLGVVRESREAGSSAEEGPVIEAASPVSTQSKTDSTGPDIGLTDSYIGGPPSMKTEFSSVRLLPSAPSSFLRAGSQFHGTQKSERQVYDVQVDIKHVDMRESFMCGYLRIQGLTEDHPTLTTYFEGEIIGNKYSFLTGHEDWGSTDTVDLQHWAKFQAFRPLAKQAKKGKLNIHDIAQRENIFMRWKEHFLVPDHRVRTINGASFEGFYYICFNQIQATVTGIYFHARSEKFQQLDLKHVPDRGCFSSVEFR